MHHPYCTTICHSATCTDILYNTRYIPCTIPPCTTCTAEHHFAPHNISAITPEPPHGHLLTLSSFLLLTSVLSQCHGGHMSVVNRPTTSVHLTHNITHFSHQSTTSVIMRNHLNHQPTTSLMIYTSS